MAMSPEIQAEYNDVLKAVILNKGQIVSENPTKYNWSEYFECQDWCALTAQGTPYEDEWEDWKGTFYPGQHYSSGVSVGRVRCSCGEIQDRVMRWEASVHEMAEAVFEEMYRRMNRAN